MPCFPASRQRNLSLTVQEISTENYPTDSTRATLQVAGFNISTAVKATDSNLSGVKLRNVQVSKVILLGPISSAEPPGHCEVT